MAPTGWNPSTYHAFSRERAAPFWELVALVSQLRHESGAADRPIERAVDLGSGSGELTAAAAERLDVGHVTGVDNAPAMLAAALEHARAGVEFVDGDIAGWTATADHDLVLANASLQWVPDHPAVLTRWAAALRPGGALAVQVPTNADHPSHRVAVATAETEPFRSALDGNPPPDPVAANVLRPEQYAELLHDLHFEHQHVRLQVFGHELASSASVVDWVRGTSLTRFSDRLPAELHEPFIEAYRTALLAELGERSPYFYAFKRILFVAIR